MPRDRLRLLLMGGLAGLLLAAVALAALISARIGHPGTVPSQLVALVAIGLCGLGYGLYRLYRHWRLSEASYFERKQLEAAFSETEQAVRAEMRQLTRKLEGVTDRILRLLMILMAIALAVMAGVWLWGEITRAVLRSQHGS